MTGSLWMRFRLRQSQVAVGVLVGLLGLAGASQAQQAAQVPPVSTMTTPASAPVLTTPVEQLTPKQITTMQRQLSDWGQLARYRSDNLSLGAPAPGEQRVVFYGDSITDGWGRRQGNFFPDKPWVNRGISGQTTPQMLVRFEQDVVALRPQAVVILAGINDIAGNTGAESLETIKDNFRVMVQLAKAAHIRVVLSSVLPAGAFQWHPGVDPREEVVALNKWLQQFAGEQKLVFLNYYPAVAAPDGSMKTELGLDGVHPNNAGYAVMEPIARAAVARALAQPAP